METQNFIFINFAGVTINFLFGSNNDKGPKRKITLRRVEQSYLEGKVIALIDYNSNLGAFITSLIQASFKLD